jgi:hypothetical protein
MIVTTVDVKTLPGARSVAKSVFGTPLAMNEYTAEEQEVDKLNATGKSDFDYACKLWLNNPTGPKPISPPSRVVYYRDYGPDESVAWIAEADGDVYGVCPDPPAPTPTPAPVNKIATGDPTANTSDLTDIKTRVVHIEDMLVKITAGQTPVA